MELVSYTNVDGSSFNMKKKILFLLPSFASVSPVKGAVALARGISQYFDITFVSLDPYRDGDLFITSELNKLKIKHFSLNNKGLRSLFKSIRTLNIFCKKNQVKVVLSYLLRADIVNACLSKKIKKISSVRNFLPGEYKIAYGPILGYLIAETHIFCQFRLNKLICISEDLRNYYENRTRYKEKVVLIRNFLDEPLMDSSEPVPAMDVDKLYTFVTVSSLTRRKNLQEFIKALAKLAKKSVPFQTVIVGDGPERSRLKSLVSKLGLSGKVKFIGHVKDPSYILKQSKIFVMTSNAEGLSRALLEALYFGNLCVVKNILGVVELLDPKSSYVYDSEAELPDVLLAAIDTYNTMILSNLLPQKFRYKYAIDQHIHLIRGLSA